MRWISQKKTQTLTEKLLVFSTIDAQHRQSVVLPTPCRWGLVGWSYNSSTFKLSVSIDGPCPSKLFVVWSVDCHWLAVLSSKLGSSFRASCGSCVESYPNVSILNMFVYEFRTYHINFIKKRTCKTRRNIHRNTRSFNDKPFKHYGRSWTFDLQTSQNLTRCLYIP